MAAALAADINRPLTLPELATVANVAAIAVRIEQLEESVITGGATTATSDELVRLLGVKSRLLRSLGIDQKPRPAKPPVPSLQEHLRQRAAQLAGKATEASA